MQEAIQAANMAKTFLTRQRDEKAFNDFYLATVQQSKKHTDDPVLPRYRRPLKRLDSGTAPHHFTSVQQYFKVQYFEVIDLLTQEISRRFNQPS